MTNMDERREDATRDPAEPERELDAARLAMLRDGKRMSIEERLDLFERLQRDAAWASGARRVR